jgi:preprotein translocase subunit SecF
LKEFIVQILGNTNIDFMSKRYYAYVASGLAVLIGVISIIIKGPNLGIDFRGGAELRVKFDRSVAATEIRRALAEVGYDQVSIQEVAKENEAIISVRSVGDKGTAGRSIIESLQKEGRAWKIVPGGVSISEVGPSVGKDLQKAGIYSIILSLLMILIYVSWRFEFRFSVGAVAALIHDVMITVGVFSLLSREINLPTLAAFLTVVGFSINDTIVVFDRIRENSKLMKGIGLRELINISVNQTLSRSIITSYTALLVVVSLFVIAGPGELENLSLALLIGFTVGVYSTVYIASAIVYDGWHEVKLTKAK